MPDNAEGLFADRACMVIEPEPLLVHASVPLFMLIPPVLVTLIGEEMKMPEG